MLIPHYDQAQTSSVAFDLSSFGKLMLTGKDRAAFLQNFTTNDVVKPGVGSGCETFVTTTQARIVAWLRVAVREQDLYLNMESGLVSKVVSHLEKYVIGEDVHFEDRTSSDFLWLLTGPNVPANLNNLGVNLNDWAVWQNAELDYQAGKYWLQRCDFLGQPAVFFWGEQTQSAPLMSFLNQQQIPLLSLDDPLWATVRIDAATPSYGIDIDETFLPQEANRTEQAVSFTKGCYVGQETVARIRAYGRVNRQLIRLQFSEPIDNPSSWTGAVLKANEKEVGKLKTVAYSPKAKAYVALGLVRKEHLKPGSPLKAVSTNAQETTVTTVASDSPLSPAPISTQSSDTAPAPERSLSSS